jgi:hypothetical protein
MGSTGVDQETHAGEHSVQTLPLGIRERRESHLDNLKRRKTTSPSIDWRTTGNWREKTRRANPHPGSEVLQPRKGRGGVETRAANLAGACCEDALGSGLERLLEHVEPPRRRGIHRWRTPAKWWRRRLWLSNSRSGEMVALPSESDERRVANGLVGLYWDGVCVALCCCLSPGPRYLN